jgi:hypothetical protein
MPLTNKNWNYEGRNENCYKFGERLLPYSPEWFTLPFPVQKHLDQNTQHPNVTSYFGGKEVWRKLHNEKPHDLYLSSNTTRPIKLKRISREANVRREARRQIHTGFW